MVVDRITGQATVPAVLFVIFGLRFIVNGITSGSNKE